MPILGLYRPFVVFREIYKATTPSDETTSAGWKSNPSSPLIGVWWFGSLIGILLTYALIAVQGASAAGASGPTWISLASGAISLVMSLFTIALVRALSPRIDARARSLGLIG